MLFFHNSKGPGPIHKRLEKNCTVGIFIPLWLYYFSVISVVCHVVGATYQTIPVLHLTELLGGIPGILFEHSSLKVVFFYLSSSTFFFFFFFFWKIRFCNMYTNLCMYQDKSSNFYISSCHIWKYSSVLGVIWNKNRT